MGEREKVISLWREANLAMVDASNRLTAHDNARKALSQRVLDTAQVERCRHEDMLNVLIREAPHA